MYLFRTGGTNGAVQLHDDHRALGGAGHRDRRHDALLHVHDRGPRGRARDILAAPRVHHLRLDALARNPGPEAPTRLHPRASEHAHRGVGGLDVVFLSLNL